MLIGRMAIDNILNRKLKPRSDIVAWENCLGKYEIVNHNIEDKNWREKIPPIFRPIFSVLLLSVLIFADDLFLYVRLRSVTQILILDCPL
jgi:hypothetical protein